MCAEEEEAAGGGWDAVLMLLSVVATALPLPLPPPLPRALVSRCVRCEYRRPSSVSLCARACASSALYKLSTAPREVSVKALPLGLLVLLAWESPSPAKEEVEAYAAWLSSVGDYSISFF